MMDTFKVIVSEEVDRMKEDLTKMEMKLIQKIQSLYKKKLTRSTQTIDLENKNKGVQCGVTCIAQIEMRDVSKKV